MRCNLIGLSGFSLSLIAAYMVIFIAFNGTSFVYGGCSSDSQLHTDMSLLVLQILVIYLIGVALSAFTPLGALLQIPSLAISLPLNWYLGHGTSLFSDAASYALAFAANIILLSSAFLAIEYPSRRLSIPPQRRLTWWNIHHRELAAKPIPKALRVALIMIVTAIVIISASFMFYVRANDVSDVNVVILVNGSMYGSVNFTLYLDGDSVHSATMVYDPEDRDGTMITSLDLEMPCGSHTLELDAWNSTYDLSIGTIDSMIQFRTLPYEEETTYLTIGVGLQ